MPPCAGYMSWDDIRKALDDGFDIGAHTISHAHLADLPLADAEARDRIQQSALLRPSWASSRSFSLTLTVRRPLAVRDAVKAAGHAAAFGQHSGVAHASEDMFYLPRFSLERKIRRGLIGSAR